MVLAIDPGGKRTGVAIGDSLLGRGRPLEIIEISGMDRRVDRIAALAAEHGVELVVVGFPVDDEGNRTPACRRSEVLSDALAARGLLVRAQSEYLSSDEARRRARELGWSRAAAIDALAACVILDEVFSEGLE
jgi:putative Holliday junction resolvase